MAAAVHFPARVAAVHVLGVETSIHRATARWVLRFLLTVTRSKIFDRISFTSLAEVWRRGVQTEGVAVACPVLTCAHPTETAGAPTRPAHAHAHLAMRAEAHW